MKLVGARALVTGATGGIGQTLVEFLEAEGCEVLRHGFRHLPEQETGAFCRADLTKEEDIDRLARAATVFDINILINNCGRNQFSSFEDADIEGLMASNVVGPMRLTQMLLPHLKSKPQAMIVNIGSTFGQIGFPGYVTYCASKAAIRGFSEALRRELSDSSVRVQHISPRATNTAMNSSAAQELNVALGNGSDEPEVLAGKMIRALKDDRIVLQMGTAEKAQVKLNSLFPNLIDQVLAKQLPTIRSYYMKGDTP